MPTSYHSFPCISFHNITFSLLIIPAVVAQAVVAQQSNLETTTDRAVTVRILQEKPACTFSQESYAARKHFINDFKSRSAFSLTGLMLHKEKMKSTSLTAESFKQIRDSAKAMSHYDMPKLARNNKDILDGANNLDCGNLLQNAYMNVVFKSRVPLFDVNNKGLFIDKSIDQFISSCEDFYLISLDFYLIQYDLENEEPVTEEDRLRQFRQAGREIYSFTTRDQIPEENPETYSFHYNCEDSENNTLSFHSDNPLKPLCWFPEFLYKKMHFREFPEADFLKGTVTLNKLAEASYDELSAYERFRKTLNETNTYQDINNLSVEPD